MWTSPFVLHEMPAMPLGIALRSGFAMNAQIQKRLRKRFFLESSKTNESVDSHKIRMRRRRYMVW
jgi:hypothetical protein